MKRTNKALRILEQIKQIDCMERGRICKMNNRNHFNHQTWENGKNIVRYLPRKNIQNLQKGIDGYKLFLKLTKQYADEIIRITRNNMQKASKNIKK